MIWLYNNKRLRRMVNYIGQSNEDRSVEKTDEEPLLQQI